MRLEIRGVIAGAIGGLLLLYGALNYTSNHRHNPHPSLPPIATATPTPAPSIVPAETPTIIPMPITARALTATATSAIVPNHVLTASYMRGDHSNSVPFATAARYATWDADERPSYLTSAHSVGMKVYHYVDPNRTYTCSGCSMMLTAVKNDPSVMAKLCDGTQITIANRGGWLNDPGVPNLTTIWQHYNEQSIQAVLPDHWDAIFEDDETLPYYTDFDNQSDRSGVPCNYTPSTWRAAQNAMTAAQSDISGAVPILMNGLFVWHGDVTGSLSYLSPSNVMGGMLEQCYVGRGWGSMGSNPVRDPFWSEQENVEIGAAQTGKLFWCFAIAGDTSGDASTAGAKRIYEYASFMLTYNLRTSLIQMQYKTTSDFWVMPETGLVAINPLVAQPTSISGLKTATDLYGREYHDCYYRRTLVGPCAFVVNPTTRSLAWPYGTKYAHTLALLGSDVLDGGSASTDGPAPPASVGPLTAVIAFQ